MVLFRRLVLFRPNSPPKSSSPYLGESSEASIVSLGVDEAVEDGATVDDDETMVDKGRAVVVVGGGGAAVVGETGANVDDDVATLVGSGSSSQRLTDLKTSTTQLGISLSSTAFSNSFKTSSDGRSLPHRPDTSLSAKARSRTDLIFTGS